MWKIKDPELKQWVNRFFSDEKIDKACRAQLEDGAFCVSLHDLGKGVFLDLTNRVFSWNTGGFNSDEWNPYPDVAPPEMGLYLVTCKKGDAYYVRTNFCDSVGNWDEEHNRVIAFKALPAPYQPEPNK